MGQPQNQLNPYTDDTELALTVLDAAAVGAVDTAILRFTNTVTSGGSSGIAVTTTANNGTIITLSRDGIYLVSWQCQLLAANSILVGVSVNAAAAALTGDPVRGVNGVVATSGVLTAPAATQLPVGFVHPLAITGAQALTGAAVRMHASDGAGNPITPGDLIAADAAIIVRRLTGLAA